MATTPTQLPVPSEKPQDLNFNAGKIDEFATSMGWIYTDRLGVNHYTIEGLRHLAEQAISAFGYIIIDSFEDGATLNIPNQILRWKSNGEYYRWDGDFPKTVAAGSTPDSSGGIGNGKWLSVGAAALASTQDGAGDALVAVKQSYDGAVARTQHDKNADSLSIKDFGAAGDGITDDTIAFQKALDACAFSNKTLYLSGVKIYTTGNLHYSFKKHSIDGENATILVSNDTTPVFNLVGHTEPGTAADDSAAYSFDNFSLYPGTAGVTRTERDAFVIGSDTYDCGGAKSDNIYISGFRYGLTFGSNSFIHNFTRWTFARCLKGTYYPPGLSNSGENINFSHCVFANSTTGIDAGGDCVINLSDSSFDYTPEKIYAHAGGIVKCNRCWFEGSDDDAVWIHTLNQLSTVFLDKCTFILTGNRTKYLFDGATPQGGVILDSPMLTTAGNPIYGNPTWGTGFVTLIGHPIYRHLDVSNDTIPYALNMSSTVSPNFSLNFTDSSRSDFSLRPASSGTTSRNETTSAAAGVTYDPDNGYLIMQPPTGNIARITRSMMASPGCAVTAGAYVSSHFSNSNDQLDLNIYFKNATGSAIATYNKRFTSANANILPERANVLRGVSAPQGTAYIEFEITTTISALDGGSFHHISNFSVEAGSGVINLQYDTTRSPATGFTPYIYGADDAGLGTYTLQQGGYTLVGNLVFVNMTITWTGHSGAGQLKVGALPYLTDFPAGEIMNVMSTGIATTGSLLGVMDAYSNSMVIDQQSLSGGLSSLQMSATGSLQITGVYRRC